MTEPVRVLHWYPNFLGGGAVANVVSGLALGQLHAGAEVRIAAADEGASPVYGKNADVDAMVLPWRPRWDLSRGTLTIRGIPTQLRRDVQAFAPDVVHAHGEFNPDNFWALRIAGRGSLVVLSPQGAFDPGVFRKSRERSKRLYAGVARRLLYQRLGSFHALSPREAEQAEAIAPGVSTYIVPQGGGPAAASALTEYTPASETTKLVFVGRLDVFTKGLDLLLPALAGVLRDDPGSVHLTLVGPDWRGGRGRMETMASELGIEEALTFTGTLPGDDVARTIDESDCVVLPSRHEGLSLSATEALVRGKPLVISTETGHASYQEIVDAPHVLAVAPDSAEIERAIRSVSARRDELLDTARAQQPSLAEFFSWNRIGRRHLEVYGSLQSGT